MQPYQQLFALAQPAWLGTRTYYGTQPPCDCHYRTTVHAIAAQPAPNSGRGSVLDPPSPSHAHGGCSTVWPGRARVRLTSVPGRTVSGARALQMPAAVARPGGLPALEPAGGPGGGPPA